MKQNPSVKYLEKNKYVHNELHYNLLDTVDEYVYLGHCLKYNLDDSNDIKIKLNKFYSSFHTVFRNFNELNRYISLSF